MTRAISAGAMTAFIVAVLLIVSSFVSCCDLSAVSRRGLGLFKRETPLVQSCKQSLSVLECGAHARSFSKHKAEQGWRVGLPGVLKT